MPTARSVYQIDFTAVASGKRIASSKRRVRWRFGLANPEALAAGEKGTACRGEEHDVTLVWSISSGKRVIVCDGQEIHFSNNRNNTFEYSWSMKGGHMLRVIAHAAPPLSPIPGWRQYDFFVDGQSFFSFPKVYRLGLAPGDPRGGPTSPASLAERGQRYTAGSGPAGGGGGNSEIAKLEAPTNPAEEDAYLQEAIRQSLAAEARGEKQPAGSVGSGSFDDLLNFAAAPPPTDAGGMVPYVGGASATGAGFYGQPPGPGAIVAVPAPYDAYGGYSPYAQQQQQLAGNPYEQQPAAAANPYAAAPPPQQPVAPSPWGAPPSMATGMWDSQLPQAQTAAPPQPTAAPNPWSSPPPAVVTTGMWNASSPLPPPPPQQIQTPTKGQTTPSSIGFSSPPADFSGFGIMDTPGGPPQTPSEPPPTPQQLYQQQQQAPPQQIQLTMNSLAGHEGLLAGVGTTTETSGGGGGSLADQAYAKLFNVDTFSLAHPSQSGSAKRDNPFESVALGEIKSHKAPAPVAKKEVMKSAPPPASSLVVSGNQNGQFGGGGMMMQQPPPPAYGGMQGQASYGGMQQQPSYGQPSYGGMQPLQGGMMQQQQPMQGGMMQQQQPMQGGMMQQPPPLGGMMQQQQPPSYGMMQQQQQPGLMMGQPPALGQHQQSFGGYAQQPPALGQQQQQPFGGYGQMSTF